MSPHFRPKSYLVKVGGHPDLRVSPLPHFRPFQGYTRSQSLCICRPASVRPPRTNRRETQPHQVATAPIIPPRKRSRRRAAA